MNNPADSKYPLIWNKDDFFIKIYCSIPNIATGILLTTTKRNMIVDPGDGILRDLNEDIGTKEILKISDVFISHGHHDHVGGLWSFLTYLSVMRREEPLNIYFPAKTVEICSIFKAFKEVYAKELSYEINMIKIEDEKPIDLGDIIIEPFPVNHKERPSPEMPAHPVPSLGFKFFYNGKSICYGGDTAWCRKLEDKASGSDLAVIEAGADDENLSDLHMTIQQATKIGETAGEFFLVHVPQKGK